MEYPPDILPRAKQADLPVSLMKFVLAYVAGECNNGAEAWRQSHPDTASDDGAKVSASRALTNANVQAAIQAELGRQLQLGSVTQDGVLVTVASIANDPKARHADRLKACEMLGRFLDLWVDRPAVQQVTINLDMGGQQPITVVNPPDPTPIEAD
jgi:hypothetical protein